MPSYNSRPQGPPDLKNMPERVANQIRATRARWISDNTPSKPDWRANEEQQRAAFLTLREQRGQAA